MMDDLIKWDKELLLYLNSFHVDWLDPVMMAFTKTLFWLPLYAFLVYFIVRNYGKACWIQLIGIAVTLYVDNFPGAHLQAGEIPVRNLFHDNPQVNI